MQKCLVAAGLLLLMASVGLANHDPSIAANDIGVNPAIPTDAQQYSITVTVRNIGQAQANNVNFAVDLDGALVANFACGNIPVAGACTRTTALRGPSVKGPHVATGRLTNCGGGCVGNNNQANLNFNVIRNEGDLTGTITDAGNNPIAGATVTELASGKTAQSDNAGAYTILDIVPGNVQVGVDAPPSYRPLTQAANIVSDQASQLNFMLQDNQQPVVQAAGPIANSKVGRTLSGDASQSTDPDGDALSFEWDWDDGTTDQTPTTSHIYAAPGDYTVTLTVTDSLGLSSAVNFNTHIVLNQLPMAVVNITTPTQIQPPLQQPQQRGQPAGLPISGILKVNQSFTFTGTRSSDPDGMIASYSWDFGDGSTGVGQTVSHFYSQPDDYQVMLTVTDDDGETSTSDIGVRALANLPPSGNITQISACFETQPCTFIAQGSDTDGYVARFLWDFGDATQPSGALPSPSAAATHTYSATGNYTLTLTVIDDNGYPANVTMRVTVFAITDRQPNRAPVVDAGQNMNAVAGQQLTFTGLAVDPEGRPVTMFWSFGDGFVSTANPATHTYAAAGTYVATLTASDGELTGSDSILVTVALRPQNNTTNTTSQQNQTTTTTTTTTTQQQTTENVPPTAFAGTDRIAVNGQLITLSGTASDPDGIIISYSWNFGDGRTGSGQTASHTYLSPGTYTATLTVMDNRGAVASDSARITVISQSTDDSTSDTIERVLATPSLSRPGQKISVLITADASAVMVEVAGQTTTLTDFNGDHLFSYEFIAPADEGNYNVVVSTLDGLETRTAEFEVDNSAPTLTIPAQLNSTAPETEITVETNENSECRLSTQDVAFERMKTFDSTGGRTHKTSVKLEFDGENNFYARCQDAAGNVQLESKAVNVKRERAGTSSISGLASGSLSDPIVGGAVLAGAVAIALTATLLYRRHL